MYPPNEAVATGYLTDGAQQRQTRIQTLQEQLTQLQYAYSASSSLADQAALDEEISSDLLSLAKFTARRDMNSAQDLSPELKGLVLRRLTNDTDSETIHAQLETIQDELTRLQAQAATDTRAITADHAGTYSGVADGYESVLTPEKLQTMTAQDYNAVTPEPVPENAIGKLIRGTTWYYVTTLPASELKGVKEGASVQLLFARDVYDQMDMTVERVGNNEAGYRLLVLSCNQYIQNVTLLRQQSADVVFNSYQGLRVPKDAVRVEDGGRPASMCSKARRRAGNRSPSSTTTARAMSSSLIKPPPPTSGRATRSSFTQRIYMTERLWANEYHCRKYPNHPRNHGGSRTAGRARPFGDSPVRGDKDERCRRRPRGN